MKIAFVIDSHPENGGAPISACSIATEMSKIYSSINLILPTQTRQYLLSEKVNTVEIEGLGDRFPLFIFNPLKALRLIISLRKKILELKPDIVHVHMPRTAWSIGLLKALKLLPQNLKYIYTDRDNIQSYRWILRVISILLIKFMYNQVTCLTGISASYWKNQLGRAKIRVIPNYAGLIYENYDENIHSKVRKKFNIDNGVFTVMFSGRMSVYKNWGLAKEIVLNLNQEDIFFIFAISTMNHEQETEFKKFCKEIKLSGVRHLIFHNATQEEMSTYYYLADIFVLTSDREAFGRTAIEAMSRKCVVIGRNVGGLPEVIGKRENLLECNVEAFCNRITYYKNNLDILNKDKNWFFKRFYSNYTVNTNISKHCLMYEEVMNEE